MGKVILDAVTPMWVGPDGVMKPITIAELREMMGMGGDDEDGVRETEGETLNAK